VGPTEEGKESVQSADVVRCHPISKHAIDEPNQ
jgi:hypothetical protein